MSNPYSMRFPLSLGLLTLFVLVAGFGTWATTTNISGAIIAPGSIEVDQNRQVVQHIDGGIVQDILVDDGQLVSEGDILLKLDPTLLKSELAIADGQYFELAARRSRMIAERDSLNDIEFDADLLSEAQDNPAVLDLVEGQKNLFHARRQTIARETEQLTKRTDQIRDQIAGIEAQQSAMAVQLELIERELSDQQALLDKGLAQIGRVLSLQREQARIAGTAGELAAQKAQAEGRVTEIDIQILGLETQRREQAITLLRDLQFQERELREQRWALTERLSRLDITAPVSGIVHGLTVFTPRSVIRPADPVLYLVPQDRPLVIAAQIEPIHIDQIRLQQDVSLRFSSLDQRETPELYGKVVKISADAFEDQTSRGRYYEAEIVLNESEINRLPEGVTLIPGMPVEAFIRTRERTPLAYLVKPFTDYFAKALREG